jgi:sortase (surface protein transpeptidase)
MSDQTNIGLGNSTRLVGVDVFSYNSSSSRQSAFNRPRQRQATGYSSRTITRPIPTTIQDIRTRPSPTSLNFKRPIRPAIIKPLLSNPSSSRIIEEQFIGNAKPKKRLKIKLGLKNRLQNYTKLQFSLLTMALLIFAVGVIVSLQTVQTNHSAAAQVAALSKKVNSSSPSNNQSSVVPSTNKISASSFNNYMVAPDLARYIKIPSLNVDARVLQVGTVSGDAVGTPDNIYDTAWYNGSAKPGQPGSTLIDGHVSSWTTKGIFYNLKLLIPGDTIQVVRGDGSVLTYQVVKSQVYPANNVDMRAAMTPVISGVSGLNLITCTGQVIKGTSSFSERVIVFSRLVGQT